MASLGWLLLGLLLGAGLTAMASRGLGPFYSRSRQNLTGSAARIPDLLRRHFDPIPLTDIAISERQFPFRVRADLQRAINQLFGSDVSVLHFTGVRKEYAHESVKLTDCILEDQHYPALAIPPEYEEVDVGDEEPVRVLKNGLWLLESSGCRVVVLLTPTERFGQMTGMQFQTGTANTPEGTQASQAFFKHLEESVATADSYRGKILSLEAAEHYSGRATGITVHRLRRVERDQVILPESTLSLLDRNVIQFVRHREKLAEFKQATKKGVLFYGPPGTGKTHTIHYLARALPGHTTLLVSAEQVGLLDEYMTLARLLQPSIVVLEDVDLIARDRENMDSACEEVLLNKLLNEMDGLKEEADILFILTTNRPQALEAALASRPGRVDQAIEFPLPDDVGRRKLVSLYASDLRLTGELATDIVRRTDGVSAAFIKELVRRTVQFSLEHGHGEVTQADVDSALDEMLFAGGALNTAILGATAIKSGRGNDG